MSRKLKKAMLQRTPEYLGRSDWRIGEEYSQVQTGNMNNYFQKEGALNNCAWPSLLQVVHEPKIFNISEFSEDQQRDMRRKGYSEVFTIPLKAGKIVSKKGYRYGIFEITAKVPNKKYMWPAIWLSGTKTWPPEIDIAEFYNNGRIRWASSNKIIAKPNIHYRDKKGTHKALNPIQRYVANPDKHYITYTLWWEKDFIKIYYDGRLVYKCTNKKILAQFNQPMRIIINNAVDWSASPTNKELEELCSRNQFLIARVAIYQK